MSDTQGPGWWQASDGRWYPPHPQPQAGYPPAVPARTAGKATAALVLALASFVVCPVIAAIAALMVGGRARREIEASGGRLGGEGQVRSGPAATSPS